MTRERKREVSAAPTAIAAIVTTPAPPSERYGEWLESLETLTTLLENASTLQQTADTICRWGMSLPFMQSTLCAIQTTDGASLRIISTAGDMIANQQVGMLIPLDTPTLFTEAVCGGQPLWIDSTAEISASLRLSTPFREISGAFALLPLNIPGQKPGILCFSRLNAPPFSDEERTFYRTTARFCAQALARFSPLSVASQDALRDSERRLNHILESIGDAFTALDREYRITYMNERALALTGKTREEAIGRKAGESFPAFYGTKVQAAVRKVMEKEVPYHFEYLSPHSRRWYETSIYPSVDGVCIYSRDIQDRRHAQEEQAHLLMEIATLNERLRQAMRETHHRVKNNLQLIAAMIDLQTMDRPETLPASEFIRLSQQVHTLATIHDILTQQASESNDSPRVSVRLTLERMLPMLEQAGGKKVRYRLDDAHLTGQEITALALVTNELVNNAIKHGRSAVEVTLVVQANTVTLTVHDDGAGFPADFDPKQAAHTGLELIENLTDWDLHGTVRFENREEGGGRVVILFPLSQESESERMN